MRRVGVVILAAGKGTRMRSRLPKVAHPLLGRPMLEHALRAADAALSPSPESTADATPGASDVEDHRRRYAVVVGHERDAVRAALTWAPPSASLAFVIQEQQRGTGDAVRAARDAMTAGPDAPTEMLALYGDTPLVRPDTLRALVERHTQARATLTFLTALADDPTGYGRVLRAADGRITGIVEQRHATPNEAAIREVNSGIYVFDASWLWPQLDRLEPHANGEYYLTDLIEAAVRQGHALATTSAPFEETRGVNDRVQLAEAEAILRARTLRALMLSGVTVQDPASTYVDLDVRIGQDTTLRPNTMVSGATVIGERCEIGPNSVIRDCTIGDGCVVLGSWLEGATMAAGSRVGPMGRLRPGARLETGANLGNFGEVKNAVIGAGTQMHHFSYVGDATVGPRVNIGAGVVFMNYDGKQKHHTEVGAGAFLGSDTLLRAPVTIGEGAATGGGAVVIRDVPAGARVAGVPARELPPKAPAEAPETPSGEQRHLRHDAAVTLPPTSESASPDHPPNTEAARRDEISSPLDKDIE